MSETTFTINGEEVTIETDPGRQLIWTLREDLELTGTKKGCSSGVCGACTVLIDGEARKSCLHLTGMVDGAEIQTVEGVSDGEELHPVQQGFLDRFSLQCGFCTPGFVMSTLALLGENPEPAEDDIVDALHGNVCRCTGYQMIFEGIEQAVTDMAEQEADRTASK